MYIITITRADGTELKGTRHSWSAALRFIEENMPWDRVAIVWRSQ